jgi:hypothetical protein
MTMPHERTRAVIAAGEFLRQIEQDVTLSVSLREMANQLLRHYPTRAEVLIRGQIEATSVSPFFGPSVNSPVY